MRAWWRWGLFGFFAFTYLYFMIAFILSLSSAYASATQRAAQPGVPIAANVQLTLTPEMKTQLSRVWNDNPGREYSACVDGHTNIDGKDLNEKYDVMDVTLTGLLDVQSGKENYVSTTACGTFAVIHKHPDGCSTTIWLGDAEAAKQQFRNGVSLYLIQCEEHKVEVFTRDNLWEGVVVDT